MSVILKNNVSCELGNAFTTADTSINVGSGNGALFPIVEKDSGEYFYLTCIDQNDENILEIMKVTETNGDIFTVERGISGTTPRAGVVSDLLEMRVTAEILNEIAIQNDKRLYLDEFFLATENNTPPTNSSDLINYNRRHAPKLLENWDSYWGTKVKVSISNLTDNKFYDSMKFNNLGDMCTWATSKYTTVGGNSQQTLIVKPYETIDRTIPVITKMYGMNRFYGALRGKRNHANAVHTADYSHSNMNVICADIFNYLLSTSYTSSTIDKKAIWLSNAKYNLYANPRFFNNEYYVDLSYGSINRSVYNSNTSAWETAPTHLYQNSSEFCYVGIDRNLSTTFFGKTASDKNYILDDIMQGNSFVMCVAMQSYASHEYKAVAIKPLGIDNVLIDYPDFTKYDLEAVYFNKNKQNYTYIKTFSSTADFSADTSFDYNKSKIRLSMSDCFNMGTLEKYSKSNFNFTTWDVIRFRLRDKNTGKVGELSASGIATKTSVKGPAFRRMYIESFV
jgi:hypothetical protein